WTEAIACEARNIALSGDLRFAIGRNGIQFAGLVNHCLACLTIIAAGRGKHEARNASLFSKLCQADACPMINVVSEAWLQIAKRVVGKCRKMKNPIEAIEIICRNVARILVDGRYVNDASAS